MHRQEVLRRHAGAGGIELQLADRDAHAVGAQVAQAEDAFAGRDADDADVLDRPVAQHVLDPALVLERHVQAVRPTEDVPELQACLADRRAVDDRQEPRRVRHQHSVEERLVGVQQLDQEDVSFQVGGLLAELLQRALDLRLFGVHRGGEKPGQAQRLALGLGKGGRLVELRVAQEVDAALGDAEVLAVM